MILVSMEKGDPTLYYGTKHLYFGSVNFKFTGGGDHPNQEDILQKGSRPACDPNTYRKIIFKVNLPLKLFRVTVAYKDIGSLILKTFFNKCLYHMLVKFEQNRMVQTL